MKEIWYAHSELLKICGMNGQSLGIRRRKIYPLIFCNIFLVIIKCCYGNMKRQTCIHTTCPSITKFAIEVIPRKRNVEIMSKPETKIWNVLCFGMWNLHR